MPPEPIANADTPPIDKAREQRDYQALGGLWLKRIKAQHKRDDKWRESARRAELAYRGERHSAFPIVFANGLDPAAGPGLVFVTLPLAFGHMGGGLVIGALFFLLLTFAALTSSISLLEPVVELIEERTPLGRVAATMIAGITIWALGIAALLSFNVWGDVKLFGMNIFDLLDYATSKFMLPLAGLGAIVFAAWKLDQQGVKAELGLGDGAFGLWTLLSRYVAPVGVLFVFWSNL